jgi:hypothetical protein
MGQDSKAVVDERLRVRGPRVQKITQMTLSG